MAEKRRGLGRGLGALIPSAPSGDTRPVDVFFPGAPAAAEAGPARTPEAHVDGERAGSAAAGVGTRPTVTTTSTDGSTGGAGSVPNGAVPNGAVPSSGSAPANGSVTGNGAASIDVGGSGYGSGSGYGAGSTNGTGATNGARWTNEAGWTTLAEPAHTNGNGSSHGNGSAAAAAITTLQDADPATGLPQGLLPVPGVYFAEVPVGSIRANPRQPRTEFDEDSLAELVGSIREVGVLQPVVVRPALTDDGQTGYELIMGERRWRATQLAGLATIPAIVRETDDNDLLRDALLENLHRSQLNALEEAAAYQQLLDDFGCTHDELAQRIHRSRPQISNTLRLLKLPPLVQRRVAAGVLSAGHARALLGLPDGASMERLAQRIVAEGLSVRSTEEIVALGGDPEKVVVRRPRPGDRNGALDDLASRLSDKFDTRVKIALGKTKGRLTVEFASVQDLNRILATLSPDDPGLLR
ncbi:ParB/RepB/Spo0J family partition protein [Cellulomonas sp. KRMCY2]|uniref:ParB/RepB/Spo0J family partition protein n=1 Tax=Cellulomonas sp. KRMCY2 TaxID=1304865 RepID=UPI00045E7A89|nr:ParB/RepB/Spo0J family partition protein [Cellulomonas sp. KRMCY2]